MSDEEKQASGEPVVVSPLWESFLGFFIDNKLVVFGGDGQIVHGKTGHRDGDTQFVLAALLDVVGGVSFGASL